MRFWISWYQPTGDHRPLAYPPHRSILGWWCTGFASEGVATICALVEAADEDTAKAAVRVDWPEAERWRFCEEHDGSALGTRFPLSDWMRERIGTSAKGGEA
mgnify:CR=1 FL=1